MANRMPSKDLKALLDKGIKTRAPGIQYLVVDPYRAIFEFAGGWADIRNQRPMKLGTTLMGYSMTKTFTAVAILQLVEQGKLSLDDFIGSYLPNCPYSGDITLRQLISHTSGIPNPIPLRWIHLAEEHGAFDEPAALAKVLRDNPKLAFKPGKKYAYSNIGYWLLGKVIEKATNRSFTDYIKDRILEPLQLQQHEMGFVIPEIANHAKGYLKKYSLLNLLKGLVTEKKVWAHYEGNWLSIKSHYINGPAFGGLVGSVRSFGRFLQDQLRESSVLLDRKGKELLYTQQSNVAGKPIGMTLGWHIGTLQGTKYFFKEGGGGGFHSEMRVYPTRELASVIMVNSTEFNSNAFLSDLDETFLRD